MKLKKALPVLLALLLLLTACAPAQIEDDDFTMPETKPLGGSPTEPTLPEPTVPAPTEPAPTEPEPTETEPTEPEPTEPDEEPTDPTDPDEEFNPGDTDHVHRFGSWKVESKATCIKEGRKVRYCDCGETETKIYVEEHAYGKWSTKEESTCTENGLNIRYCTVCNAEDITIKAPLGHDEVVTSGIPATCMTPGIKDHIQCGRCGEVLQEATVIEAGHKIVEQKYVAPECGLPGQTEGSYCSACLEVFQKSEIIPAIEHIPVTVPGKAATCTDVGLTDSIVCSECDAVLSRARTINRLAHDMVDGVCSRCGHNCDHGVDPEKIDKAGEYEKYVGKHQGDNCLDVEYSTYACEKCGQESQYYVSYIHGVSCDTTDYRVVVDPTPDRTGLTESHCKTCGQATLYILDGIIHITDERFEFYSTGGVKFQHGEGYWDYFTISDERPAGSSTINYQILSDTELKVIWLDENGEECFVVLHPSTDEQRPCTKCVISTDGKAYVSHFGWVAVG